MLLDNYLIRALTGDHSAYKQKEAEATQCTQTGYAPVNGLEAFHNLGWGAVDAVASPRLRYQHNLQVDFNFSSTYSESSIMRSANCSAGSPAKFLSTNSFT